MKNSISIKGARANNLKNISLDLPRNKFIVITGLSGSGKSSLAFETLYAEGQRRYVESLSSYARQFLGIMGNQMSTKLKVYRLLFQSNKNQKVETHDQQLEQ